MPHVRAIQPYITLVNTDVIKEIYKEYKRWLKSFGKKKTLVFYGSSSEIWFAAALGFYSDQVEKQMSHVSALRWLVAQYRYTCPAIQWSSTYLGRLWAFLKSSLVYINSFIGQMYLQNKVNTFRMQKSKSEVKLRIWNSYSSVKCVVVCKYFCYLCCVITT